MNPYPVPGSLPATPPRPEPEPEPEPVQTVDVNDPRSHVLTALLVEHQRLENAMRHELRMRYEYEIMAYSRAREVERLTTAIYSVEAGIRAIKVVPSE